MLVTSSLGSLDCTKGCIVLGIQQTQLEAAKEKKDFYLGEFVMVASFQADSIAVSLFGNMIREIRKYDRRDLEI